MIMYSVGVTNYSIQELLVMNPIPTRFILNYIMKVLC